MRSQVCRWRRGALRCVQDGQGLVEYGLLITLISIAAIAIMAIMGDSVTSLFVQVPDKFSP